MNLTRRRLTIALAIGVAGGVVVAPVLAQTSVETEVTGEAFDSAESAAAAGWSARRSTEGGSDFGWAATNATGRTPGGEAGGILDATGEVGWYADVSIGGALTLDDRIASTGEIDVLGRGGDTADIAHFRLPTDQSTGAVPRVGVAVRGATATPELVPVIVLDDGTELVADAGVEIESDGDYRYQFVYEPSGGDNGMAMLHVFSGADELVGVTSVALSADQRATGLTVNAFGLLAGASGGSNAVALVIDQVVYSVGGPLIATT